MRNTKILFLALLAASTFTYAGYTSSPKFVDYPPNQQIQFQAMNTALPNDKALPTVMLLGGGPGFSSWNLEPIQKEISQQGFNVLLMDMVGIRDNQHIKATNPIEQWILQIEKVLSTRPSNTQPVTLIGHSWGALMALLYLREYPEQVDKVILLNPVDPEKKAMQNLTDEIHQRNQMETEQKWDDDAAWTQKTEVAQSEIERITLRQIQQVLPTYFVDYQQGLRYAKQFTIEDFNIDLNVQAWKDYDANPVQYDQVKGKAKFYFLECKQDYLMPYSQLAYQQNLTLSANVVLDGCGHFPWIEKETQFYNHLTQFLDE